MNLTPCCNASVYVRAYFNPSDRKDENDKTLCELSEIDALCSTCNQKVDFDEANVLATLT